MSSAPTIRDSIAADIPAITAIYAVHVRQGSASFEITPPSEAEMAQRRATILAADLPYLVADLDGRVAGYAYAGAYRPRPAYRHTVEHSVYVAEGTHRRGVGRALLQTLIRACETAGKRQMIAVIGDAANVASIALHEAVGFQHAGRLKDVGFKHGGWLDVVLMQRSLGPGAETPPTD
ncbi:L-methionine sulfoximine/L-methionine sulfone acetyltransferase [Candidatus Entotheonellaceae bacterium PAL068K]